MGRGQGVVGGAKRRGAGLNRCGWGDMVVGGAKMIWAGLKGHRQG